MHIRKRPIILVLILFALFASHSWGFEQQAHIEMSKTAVRLYTELYPVDALNNYELTSIFIETSAREDDITFSLQRAFNWHFYDPGSRLGRSWWGASRSNTERFAGLAEDLVVQPANEPGKIYEYAGRLAHHIQDMSSPPHAVPVYHTTKDPFDKYATETIFSVRPSQASLEALKAERKDISIDLLKSILKTAADRTIDKVSKPVIYNGNEAAADWTGFWRHHELTGQECREEPKTGFGCYGKNVFGEASDNFTKEIYLQFYKTQVSYAIEDTLRLLIMLQDMKKRKSLTEGPLDTALN